MRAQLIFCVIKEAAFLAVSRKIYVVTFYTKRVDLLPFCR